MLDEQRQAVCPKCGGVRWERGGPATIKRDPDCDVCHGAGLVSEARADQYRRKELEARLRIARGWKR
jgi:hypothetical protein